MTQAIFPFSAVVGQEDVKLGLLLNAVDRRIGGLLLRGEKGSAKSTLARALAGMLGEDAPFVELPVSATEDRVVGTLDLEAALTRGERRFQPGLLHAVDNGVLYVDEVNLLPDHLVDVLLDVAASGVNRVEREGVSESHPSRFVLVGSMNPEEGDLRPQLLDRFGLAVDVAASLDPRERAEAVRRRLAFDRDAEAFGSCFAGADAELARRIARAHPAELPDELLERVSSLCASVGAEGLRADLVICRAAAALASWEGRPVATAEDVRRVAPLALGHRRRRSPLEDAGIDPGEIDRGLGLDGEGRGPAPRPGATPGGAGPDPGTRPGPTDGPGSEPGPAPSARQRSAAEPEAPTRIVPLSAPATTAADGHGGRRSIVRGTRGRLVGDRELTGPLTGVALGATVRAAAGRRTTSPPLPGEALVQRADLREAVREQKTGNLIVIAVDASASMGSEGRMGAVKGAVLSLLVDAYQRRDRVALVTFGGEEATVALRPTGSVEVARARLAELCTGGRTPLAAGIETALGVASTAGASHRPLVVLVSDGRATAAPEGMDPLEAARAAALQVRTRRVPAVVIDVEDGRSRLGLAAALARDMAASCLTLPELSAGALTGAIHEVIGR